jgi:hypothetical protein
MWNAIRSRPSLPRPVKILTPGTTTPRALSACLG